MNARPWDAQEFTRCTGIEVERMAGVVRGADPELPVPTCPEWTLGQLVKHTGTIHRWAARMVRDRAPERLDPRTLDLGLPPDASGYADWLAAGQGLLSETFADADPDAPMWAWGADQHARFWIRRMLHETAIHRVDAQLALGIDADVEAGVAADGIDELFENLPTARAFRPRVVELRGAGGSIALRPTDGDARELRLRPDGFEWSAGTIATDPAVTAFGTTGDLLLLFYARRPLNDPRVSIAGDRTVLERWLDVSML